MRSLIKRTKHGFTLLELMLVLGGVSVLSAGGFVTYKHVHLQNETTQAVSNTRLLSNILMQSYGQTGSFAELSNASLINGRLLPSNFNVKGNAIQNSWGGSLTATPSTTTPAAFSLSWSSVPSAACSGMTTQLSKNFPEIQINGTSVQGPSQALDVPSVAKMCGGTDKNTVTLVSNAVALPDPGEPKPVTDHGAPPRLPIPAPETLSGQNVKAIDPLVAALPFTPTKLQTYPTPTVSNPGVGSGVSPVSDPAIAAALPPLTASCIPSRRDVPVVTTEYNQQVIGCQPGYVGSITQQQSRTKTVTTTTIVSCATVASTPVTTITDSTSYGTYTAWSNISNSCAATCATQLSWGGYPARYQWGPTVNVGCPSGYTGQNTYQPQQVSTAYCSNPSGTAAPVYGGWSNTGVQGNVVNTCVPAVPAIHNATVGLSGGYGWTPGRKAGMGTCALLDPFNTYVLWSADQGNPADYYNITLTRKGQTLSWKLYKSQVFCSASCAGTLSMSYNQVHAFVPEIDYSTLVYDHAVYNGSGGVTLYPWMMNGTLTVQSCLNSGACSAPTTETSMDISVFSQGRRDCEAENGGTTPWPLTAYPPGQPR